METTPIPNPSPAVKPLSRRGKSGEMYKRESQVETQIKSALALQPDELLQRAALDQPKDSVYLQEESLIYLIRAYHKVGNRVMVENLFGDLISRCQRFVANNFSRFDPPLAEEGCQEVWASLADKILRVNDSRGDYYEVRFWDGLHKIILSIKWRMLKSIQGEKDWVPLSDLAGQDLEFQSNGSDEDIDTGTVELPAFMSIEQRVIWNEGFNQLPEPTRTIVWLYYFEGWQIDSKDPEEPTLSRLFQRTPRMIKYRLRDAERILEEWRGKDHD